MPRSRIAEENRKAMIDRCRRMTPDERLAAHIAHSRLMVELCLAGARYRSGRPSSTRKKRPKRR
jgi:hypothetical protein